MKHRNGFVSNSSSSSFIVSSKISAAEWERKYIYNIYHYELGNALEKVLAALRSESHEISIPYGGEIDGIEDQFLDAVKELAPFLELKFVEVERE